MREMETARESLSETVHKAAVLKHVVLDKENVRRVLLLIFI